MKCLKNLSFNKGIVGTPENYGIHGIIYVFVQKIFKIIHKFLRICKSFFNCLNDAGSFKRKNIGKVFIAGHQIKKFGLVQRYVSSQHQNTLSGIIKSRRFKCRFNADYGNRRVHITDSRYCGNRCRIAGNYKTFTAFCYKHIRCVDCKFCYFIQRLCTVRCISRITKIYKIFIRHKLHKLR